MTIPATDRRSGKPAGHAAPQPAEARHGGRPHHGKQQRGQRRTAAVMAVPATTATGPITAAIAAKTVRARTVTPRTGRTLRQGSQTASEMLHS